MYITIVHNIVVVINTFEHLLCAGLCSNLNMNSFNPYNSSPREVQGDPLSTVPHLADEKRRFRVAAP